MAVFVGIFMIAILIVALVKFKILPISIFATLPIIAALILGFGVTEIFGMAAKGIISVLPTAALFIGSITYFGIMDDAGLFDRPVNWLVKRIKPSVFSVLMATICIAVISHLDGSGTTTIMVTVPAMLPIAKKLKVRILPLYFILSMTIAVMNLLPWGGPLGRASTVVGVDAVALWKQIIPVQIAGIVLLFVSAWLLARQEEKLGFGAQTAVLNETGAEQVKELARPNLYWVNLLLTVAVIVLLFLGCPAFLPFLIGLGIALPLNYGREGDRAQEARVKAHAGKVVPMILTIIGAGIFLGVLTDAGIIDALATAIAGMIPSALGQFMHVIMGILAIPLSLVFEADTMNYGMLPVVAQVGEAYGISQVSSALSIAVGHNVGVGLCMTNASVYFALGLFGLDYGEALKYSFLKVLAFASVLILSGALLGVL